jgi:hypothetical protein
MTVRSIIVLHGNINRRWGEVLRKLKVQAESSHPRVKIAPVRTLAINRKVRGRFSI